MINTAAFIGEPLEFKDICKVYSPTVREVSRQPKYYLYRKLLTTSQEEIEDEYNEKNIPLDKLITPFQQLMIYANQGEESYQLIYNALKFFIREEVSIVADNGIIFIGNIQEELSKVKDVSELRMINEDNFFEFQNLIRTALNDKVIPAYNANMDPRKKRMLALARQRDKVKAKKTDGIDFSTTLAAICCMNMGINPLNIGEITVGAIPVLMAFYQNKEKYELDIQSLLAGADSKKIKPKYWIKNLDEN